MAGKVPEHVIQQVARSANIIAIVSRHTNLKQRGKKFWGLCPFHKEKTPSFSVDPEQGLFYCFGCKEGGNVFTFLNKTQGLDFYDALQQLAREAGIDLSHYEGRGGPARDKLDRLRELCELAASFYAKCLEKAKGSDVPRQYLKKRQISDESVARWLLGYAPDGWEHLLEFARRRSIKPHDMEEAGLIVPRSGAEGYYDRFRNRLMFPVRNRQGKIIGFGARALSDEDKPKYLNSPEGPLFTKGECFYGFCEAREAVRSSKTAVIVEGYTDVIMAHQFGVEHVMGVLGTALTESHARTLASLCERVVLVFDADEAGDKSATRSIELLLAEDLEVRVGTLDAGLDPCDFLLARGAEAFRERLEGSEDFFQFRLRRARELHDTTTVNGRAKAFQEVASLALRVRNEAKRDMLIRTIAGELGVAERSAWAYMERTWGRPTSRGSAASAAEPSDSKRHAKLYDEAVALQLVGLLLTNPDLQKRAVSELEIGHLQDCAEKKLLERLLASCKRRGQQTVADFAGGLDDPELGALVAAAVTEEEKHAKAASEHSAQEVYEGCRADLEERRRRRELDDLRRQLLSPANAAAAPTATASEQGASSKGESKHEDALLRDLEQKQKERDKKASRINPAKRSS